MAVGGERFIQIALTHEVETDRIAQRIGLVRAGTEQRKRGATFGCARPHDLDVGGGQKIIHKIKGDIAIDSASLAQRHELGDDEVMCDTHRRFIEQAPGFGMPIVGGVNEAE